MHVSEANLTEKLILLTLCFHSTSIYTEYKAKRSFVHKYAYNSNTLEFIVRNRELCSKIENDYRLSGIVLVELEFVQFVVLTKLAHHLMIFRTHQTI